MAWRRQATSHYLNQCWPSSKTQICITNFKWVIMLTHVIMKYHDVYEILWWNPMILWNTMTKFHDVNEIPWHFLLSSNMNICSELPYFASDNGNPHCQKKLKERIKKWKYFELEFHIVKLLWNFFLALEKLKIGSTLQFL